MAECLLNKCKQTPCPQVNECGCRAHTCVHLVPSWALRPGTTSPIALRPGVPEAGSSQLVRGSHASLPTSMHTDIILVAWNQALWGYLSHRNGQQLQIRASSCFLFRFLGGPGVKHLPARPPACSTLPVPLLTGWFSQRRTPRPWALKDFLPTVTQPGNDRSRTSTQIWSWPISMALGLARIWTFPFSDLWAVSPGFSC